MNEKREVRKAYHVTYNFRYMHKSIRSKGTVWQYIVLLNEYFHNKVNEIKEIPL